MEDKGFTYLLTNFASQTQKILNTNVLSIDTLNFSEENLKNIEKI